MKYIRLRPAFDHKNGRLHTVFFHQAAIQPRSKNTGWFQQEYTGRHRNIEAGFRQENLRNFFRWFPTGSWRKAVRMHLKKFRNSPGGILLPCSGIFWYIPAGSSVFSVSFLQVPSGSSDQNLRPGIICFYSVRKQKQIISLVYPSFLSIFFIEIILLCVSFNVKEKHCRCFLVMIQNQQISKEHFDSTMIKFLVNWNKLQ